MIKASGSMVKSLRVWGLGSRVSNKLRALANGFIVSRLHP